MLQSPTAIRTPAGTDDVDRLGEALVARGVDGLEVVQRAKDVVVPPRRKGKAREDRIDDFAVPAGAEQPMLQEELTPAPLRDTHRAQFAPAV
jgi:hypothetical protein